MAYSESTFSSLDASLDAPAVSRYATGLRLLDEAQQSVVGGVKRMNRLDEPEHFPLFFSRARGPYVWDVDGHRYIDLISGKATVLLGYGDERVDGAVIQAIRDGAMPPLTSDLYPRIARRVCEAVPSIERVKFFRTGSCAVSAAVRLVRVGTGKRKILSCGYHGWHDWFIEDRRPAPDPAAAVVDFHYDLDMLEKLVAEGTSEIAAIVVTPEASLFDRSFLKTVEEIARAAGLWFVLDEIKTGFRYGMAGYQALAGVRPDLTTFAKAIANGYALSALGGRREVMEVESSTHVSSTYETENIGLAAGLATLEVLAGTDYAPLRKMYASFVEEMNNAFRSCDIAARCVGSEANAQIIFDDEAVATEFYRRAAAAGVTFYCFDDVNLTFSHEPVFAELLEILTRVVRELPEAAKGGQVSHRGVHQYLVRHKILPRTSKDPNHPVVRIVHQRLMEA